MPRKAKKPITSVTVVTNGPDAIAGSTPSRVSSSGMSDAAKRGRREHADHREPDHQAEIGDLEPGRSDGAHDHRKAERR